MKKLNNWLENNTFQHSQFWDLKKLVEKKEERNLKISLCFPTLNEEETIGKEIILISSELKERYPLIDEIAVIDSGSTDNTQAIAEEYGAKFFLASDYLQEEGKMKGKGENLWKAIYLLKGDIIVFIDSDILNIHPKFVYGLLGPILYNDPIKYVKAFYERPINLGGGLLGSGGGRVTEILIRPLFAQFFPELAAVIQPLSGEFAGYREIFEQLPFPVGYGVETSQLIDIYQKWGLDAIAQTNLDERIHRNQSTKALGKMSFGILQTFWNRLSKYKGIDNISLENFSMINVETDENKTSKIITRKIVEQERPPMIEVEAYKNRK
ncbi:MAG: glucosyl-3-phosphoglycerate synthase [Verrucomicrobiota bacterium]|nr:glucosyl-3-phosphoglycerate synthase [Verrucomicrobiota bacterium]